MIGQKHNKHLLKMKLLCKNAIMKERSLKSILINLKKNRLNAKLGLNPFLLNTELLSRTNWKKNKSATTKYMDLMKMAAPTMLHLELIGMIGSF